DLRPDHAFRHFASEVKRRLHIERKYVIDILVRNLQHVLRSVHARAVDEHIERAQTTYLPGDSTRVGDVESDMITGPALVRYRARRRRQIGFGPCGENDLCS